MARSVLEELVKAWHINKTSENLEKVVSEATGYVRGISSRVINPATNVLDRDDLIQCGLIALVSCVRRWRPDAKVPFRTFIYPRVKGAMQDAVRSASSTSRTRNIPMISYETVAFSLEANLRATEREETVLTGMSARQISMSLVKALSSLSIRQQAIILLSLNGLRTVNIANILDISDTSIRHERQTAVSKLSQLLSDNMTATVEGVLAESNSHGASD